MAYTHQIPARGAISSAVRVLAAFPLVCFTLTTATDLAYARTENLLWLHFSEWLLLAGLVFGVPALLLGGAGRLTGHVYPGWLALGLGAFILLLAAINSFIHTADGWTAVMPWGLTVSVVTMLIMAVAPWLARAGDHV